MWPYFVEIMIPPSEVSLKARRQGLGRRLMTELLHRLPGLPGGWRLFHARVGWVPLELWGLMRGQKVRSCELGWPPCHTITNEKEIRKASLSEPGPLGLMINVCAMVLIQKMIKKGHKLVFGIQHVNVQPRHFLLIVWWLSSDGANHLPKQNSIAFLTAVILHIVKQPSLSIGAMRLYQTFEFAIFLVGTSFEYLFGILNLGASKSRLQFENKTYL